MTVLTKWPRLVVTGERVTPEQADVILIRTRYPWVSSDDAAWQWAAEEALRMPHERERDEAQRAAAQAGGVYDWVTYFDDAQRSREELGWLGLNYLFNSRIGFVGRGWTEGWCDWDGGIGCSGYNIGKWPTVVEVTEEWRMVAEAFPYLKLDCQVVTEEGDGVLAAQWHVEGGLVRQVEIGPLLVPLEDPPLLLGSGHGVYGGGVEIDRLRAAVARTVESLKG